MRGPRKNGGSWRAIKARRRELSCPPVREQRLHNSGFSHVAVSRYQDGIRLRIKLNLGDVIVQEDGDLYGEGINIAARLEGLADPGGILVSAKVHDEIEGKLDAALEDRGERQLKNMSKLIRTYALAPNAAAGPSSPVVTKAAQEPALPDKTSVLPFQNMSDDPEQEPALG